jgi:hypothetical protein
MPKYAFRRYLSAPGLIKEVRACFERIEDNGNGKVFSLSDCLMSGFAVFSLKYPSLLQFDQGREDDLVRANLKSLYGIDRAPSDTYLRERLDNVSPELLRRSFRRILHLLQRGKGLEGFEYLDGYYLLSIDGTGYFSSSQVHCEQCCQKHHRDGRVTYYHQMLSAVLVHPDQAEVFPLAPEPIMQQDGYSKNDCERTAAVRLLNTLRREHPHMKLIVIEDGLASNAPHIRLLQKLNLHFILGAKQTDHQFLFDWVNTVQGVKTDEFIDGNGIRHSFRYLNGAPLNDANFELEVNFLEYREYHPSGETQHFSWVTDITITPENLMQLMRAGRARWKIENETFNTLKTQGYHFEHNFGHGYRYLSTVFACLMMLAFLVDQVQQHCCLLLQRAKQNAKRNKYFWEKVRGLFLHYLLPDWETLYKSIAFGIKPTVPVFNDSS